MASKGRIPLQEYPAHRIALIKPSALGDIIHSLPVLTALRQRYPNAHITWIVNRGYEPLLIGHPDLNSTLPFDRSAARGGITRGLWSYGVFLKRCRTERFDLVIDLQGLLRSALMVAACGAARRVGLSTAREGAAWFYSDVVPVADFNAIHAVDRYWLVASAFGAGDGPKQFRVPINPIARRWAIDALLDCPRPWLAVAVGSRWRTKRWPPQSFAELIARMQRRFGGTAIFVGSKDEIALSQSTAGLIDGPFRDYTGRTTLPQLSGLLAEVDALLGNDTGPLHLAAALGRPVAAPYTCTKILLNGPYGAERGARESTVWCQGSYLKSCRRLDCMAELKPDRLWPVLQDILWTWEINRRSA